MSNGALIEKYEALIAAAFNDPGTRWERRRWIAELASVSRRAGHAAGFKSGVLSCGENPEPDTDRIIREDREARAQDVADSNPQLAGKLITTPPQENEREIVNALKKILP